MSEEEKASPLIGWLRRCLTPAQGALLTAVVLPLLVLMLVFKARTVATIEAGADLKMYVDLCASELLLALALGAFGFAGFCLIRQRRTTYAFGGLLQAVAALVAAVNIASHQFVSSTGTHADWNLIGFAVENFGEVHKVIGSEVPVGVLIFLGAITGLFFVGPQFLARRIESARAISESGAQDIRSAACAVVVALVLLLVAAMPRTGLGVSTGLSREATLHITLSALGDESLRGEAAPDGRLYETGEASLVPAESEGDTPRNLVFIILESTRASSTTLHNPELDTTPYLRELSSSSLVMEEAYAVLPHTSKALVAMLCGIPPMPTMSNVEADPGIIPGRCLPELLESHDYRSLFMQSATADFEDRTALVDQMGYDDFYPLEKLDTDGFEKANYFGYEEDIMLSQSDEWLAEHGDEPFFTTYLTLSPHHNYLAPRRYGRYEFAEDDTFNRYLNAVHYLDNFVENVLDQYRERGLYESSLFVIVGDHGEAFGEHGRYQHDNVIYNEGVHVPWLIHSEQTREQPGRIDEPVSHLDILPTAVEMLGYEIEKGDFPGTSVFEAPDDRLLFFTCWYEDRCIGLLREDEKFIYHYNERSPQLFDLSEDPAEQTNVIDEYDDDYIARLRQIVLTWKQLAAKPYLEE